MKDVEVLDKERQSDFGYSSSKGDAVSTTRAQRVTGLQLGFAACTFRETHGYTFKHVPQEYIKTLNDSILELQFAVKAPASAHVRVTATDTNNTGVPEQVYWHFITQYTYELNIDYQNHLSFEHVGVMGPSAQKSKKVLSSQEFRPFWLRFNVTSGQLSFGHVGQNEALINWTDADYTPRKFATFSIANLRSTYMDAVWIFCDDWKLSEEQEKMEAGIQCTSLTPTKDGALSDYFKAEDEFSYATVSSFNFALGAPKNSSGTVYFLDSTKRVLFELPFIEDEVSLVVRKNSTSPVILKPCDLTSGKLQPIQIMMRGPFISLDCGKDWDLHLLINDTSLNASFVRFVSNGSTPAHWLHGCKGIQRQAQSLVPTSYDNAEKERMNQLYNSVFKNVSTSSTTYSSAEEAVQNVLRSCRVVQTFRPSYDQFFEMHEGGTINGSFSRLLFTVWGSYLRIKLSEDFPVTENFYEILLGIGNSTTISRSGDSAAAYVDTDALWKNTTLHQFIIEHDAGTGDINIINKHESVLTWKDTKAFPVRFFSVSSGYIGRLSNSTWIFGCEKRQRQCFHPVHANQYLYSQYFWLSREGSFSPETNSSTLEIWVRAKNSAHFRLEPVLPYLGNPPATVEFDFGVENRINLDILSHRKASQTVLHAVNEDTFTGYWIKQDFGLGLIELGKIGETKGLLRYQVHGRLRPLLYFSGTNSQRAGNSTWVFGCAGGEQPGIEASTSPGEDYFVDQGGYLDVDDSDSEIYEELTTSQPGVKVRTTASTPSTTQAKTTPNFRSNVTLVQWLKGLGQPSGNTSIHASLQIHQVTLATGKVEVALHGSLELTWKENITWPVFALPSEVTLPTESHIGWVSRDLVITKGTLTIDKKAGSVITRYCSGEAVLTLHSVKIEPSCVTDVTSWPKERRTCSFDIALWGHHEKMVLKDFSVEVDVTASVEAGWEKPSIRETNGITQWRHGTLLLPSKKIKVLMQLDAGPLYGLYVTPLIITAIVVLVCGLIRTLIGSRVVRTLKERSIVLCCALFVLGAIAVAMHGKLPDYCTSLPTLLWAYIWSSAVVVAFLLLSLVIGSRISSASPPPSWLVQLFSGKITSNMLCLSCSNVAPSNQGVQFKSESDEVYLSTTVTDGGPCSCSEAPTTQEQQVSWFWSWQLVITALDRLITVACFATLLVVISMLL